MNKEHFNTVDYGSAVPREKIEWFNTPTSASWRRFPSPGGRPAVGGPAGCRWAGYSRESWARRMR